MKREVIPSNYLVNRVNELKSEVYNSYINYINECIKEYKYSIYHKEAQKYIESNVSNIHRVELFSITNDSSFLDSIVKELEKAGWLCNKVTYDNYPADKYLHLKLLQIRIGNEKDMVHK